MARDLELLALPESALEKAIRLAAIAGLHVLVIGGALSLSVQPDLREVAREIQVRLIEQRPAEPSRAEPVPSKPPPQVVRPAPRRKLAPPPPVLTAAPEAPPRPAELSVPLQPAPEPVAAVQAPSAPPAPVTPVRFDAEYLRNPKPAYPVMSRRLGEQGRVVLHVRVLASGTPAEVEIRTSSGFPRLDQAAREAVAQWRFTPSRRGDEAIDAWVLVPIQFALGR